MEIKEILSDVTYYEPIATLQKMSSKETSGKTLGIPVDANGLRIIENYSAISMTCLLNVNIEANINQIYEIITTVENIVFNTLLLLDLEFDNLDDLGIDFSNNPNCDKIFIQINSFINDNSVSIGNNNKIFNSKFK